MTYSPHPLLGSRMLPVDIVLAPAWWHRHEGITFDADYYFHPAKRVEVERLMERALYKRWGRFGLGGDHDKLQPVVGPVHLAAGFLLSEMLGCTVEYVPDGPPLVRAANRDMLDISPDAAFQSDAYRRWDSLCDALKKKHGGLVGDINWGGVLNLGLDVRGQDLLVDMVDRPDDASRLFQGIAAVIDKFTDAVLRRTGSTSISTNRTVRWLSQPVYLHSECSLVMISTAAYERMLMPFDVRWSQTRRPFGIHYCGKDPHRYAEVFSRLPHLDFLDVGWGGDVARLRQALPNTFLNVRYSPTEIVKQSPDEIRQTVRRLVHESDNPWLTGVCCINMDDHVTDEQVTAILEETETLRAEYAKTLS
jgi:hypothetical protein